MDSNNKTARTAGFLYLIVIVTGLASLIYLPSLIDIRGDAATTINNIRASEFLLRLAIAVGAIQFTVFLLLPLVLYQLLSPVSKKAAVLMVAFAVVFVPIDFVALANELNILSLLHGDTYRAAFTTEQLHAQVMLSFASFDNAILVSELFWGLWLLPFGYLVFKSGYLPKVLGILLMMGCFSNLIGFFEGVLFPGHLQGVLATIVMLPAPLGEFGICLWLLIVGARKSILNDRKNG
jgi:hypothetical protein